MHPRPNWQKDVASCAYAVLLDECARRQRRATISYAELAERLFRRRESTFVTHAINYGQIPSGLTLQRMETESEAARRLLDLIPAFAPQTSAEELRDMFAAGLSDLQVSPYVVDLARIRDVDFLPGAIRALHSPCWVSRLILEAIQLRRCADRGAIKFVLAQGWNTAAALLDLVAEFPTVPKLREVAKQLWGVATDAYLPGMSAIKRGAAVIALDLNAPMIDLRQCRWAQWERTRLQDCVALALSSLQTPRRISRMFPGKLGVELYIHFTYRPTQPAADTAPTVRAVDRFNSARAPTRLAPHVPSVARCNIDCAAFGSESTDQQCVKPPRGAGAIPQSSRWTVIPSDATCIKSPSGLLSASARPHQHAHLLWDANVEPILFDPDLTKSFRVRNSLTPT